MEMALVERNGSLPTDKKVPGRWVWRLEREPGTGLLWGED